jgi:hypothetical protein
MPKDLSPKVREYHEDWISHYPESWHRNSLDRFYLFVGALLRYRRKAELSRDWLEANLRKDCPQMREDLIQAYSEAYEYIKDFKTVEKRWLVQVREEEERKRRYEKIKAELESKLNQ